MRVAAHQLSLVILHTMDKPLVYYGIRSHRAQHIFFSLTNMTTTEEIRQELNEAKVKEQKAEAAVTAFEARYKPRLTWLEDKLWGNEGTATERAEWKEEKTRLEERQKSLEKAKEERLKQVEELQRALTTVTTQPGNDFVTRALGT